MEREDPFPKRQRQKARLKDLTSVDFQCPAASTFCSRCCHRQFLSESGVQGPHPRTLFYLHRIYTSLGIWESKNTVRTIQRARPRVGYGEKSLIKIY